MRCIDAHHHLWSYSLDEYGWIDDSMLALRRDFLPAELEAVTSAAGVEATIAVQARQTLEETRWLLNFVRKHACIAGVVGWAPIASPEFPAVLEELRENQNLRGLRHVLQGELDEAYALRGEFQRGIAALQGTGLVYDILIYERQLPMALELVDRNPNQMFVLDHLAKPKIALGELSPWRENLRELAHRPQVVCKVSGMVTEAHWEAWTPGDLEPYLDAALECFGPGRLLAGSDWPVCTLATSYERWWKTLRQWASKLSAAEQECILGANAVRTYQLEGYGE